MTLGVNNKLWVSSLKFTKANKLHFRHSRYQSTIKEHGLRRTAHGARKKQAGQAPVKFAAPLLNTLFCQRREFNLAS
jgi:hypothetical protein